MAKVCECPNCGARYTRERAKDLKSKCSQCGSAIECPALPDAPGVPGAHATGAAVPDEPKATGANPDDASERESEKTPASGTKTTSGADKNDPKPRR